MTKVRDLLRREIREHLEAVYRLDGVIRALEADEAGENAADRPETPPASRSVASGGANEPTTPAPVVPWQDESS